MRCNPPTILKSSETVLLEIEEAVRQFPRYHKYAIGAELRTQARNIVRLAHRAWMSRDGRLEHVETLSVAIDELKLSLQLCQRLRAFHSFKQFEALSRLVSKLGQQCGGWRKSLHGQNRETSVSPGRAQILSARDASTGANP